MKRATIALLLLATSANAADGDRTWHLLQKQANGGIAAILHGMTKEECQFAKDRIEGNPATSAERAAAEAKLEAQMARLAAWQKGHPTCKGMISTSAGRRDGQEFSEEADGVCIWHQPGGWRTYGPRDVIKAECFE